MYLLNLNTEQTIVGCLFTEDETSLGANQVEVQWDEYLTVLQNPSAPLRFTEEGRVTEIPTPSVYHSWVDYVWQLDAAKLNQAYVSKWNDIKTRRDVRLNGGFKVGTYWYHSDDPSRIKYLGLMMMGAGIPTGLQWKTMSGAFVTMTQSLAYQIFTGIAVWDSATFIKTEQHKAAMQASSDPLNYDFTTSWPPIYGE